MMTVFRVPAVMSCIEDAPPPRQQDLFSSFAPNDNKTRVTSSDMPHKHATSRAEESPRLARFAEDDLAHDAPPSPEIRCLAQLKHLVFPLGTVALREDLGVYVLWEGEGLWRQQQQQQRDASTALPESCFPSSDFIRHHFAGGAGGGGESISDKYMPSQSYQCAKAYVKDVRRGKGSSEVCEWLSPELEVQSVLAPDSCLFNSPVCNDTKPASSLQRSYVKQHSRALIAKRTIVTTNDCSEFFVKEQYCQNSSDLFSMRSVRVKIDYNMY
jgi:hypothetical protein